MVDIPNVKAAEPIPSQVMSEITDLMSNGDLFRYNSEGSAAHRLEIEFSKVMGVRYSLAVSSCSAALFLALKSLNLPSKAPNPTQLILCLMQYYWSNLYRYTQLKESTQQ